MRPVKVLHVAAGNLYGGVETFLATLASYRDSVPELDSEFALCFEGRLATELSKTSAKVHSLGEVRLRNPLHIARANLRLARLLKEKRYDAVITHGAWPHVLVGLTAKWRKVKLVTYAHGAPIQPGALDRMASLISADLVIVNSHHTLRALGDLFAGAPSCLVYCPVAPRATPIRSRARIREELQTAESTTVIAFAARFERWKGHDLLLRAARALLDRTDGDWCIWMCGGVQRPSEKEYLVELKNYVDSAGLGSRVRFLGERSDIPDLLQAADLFCQPNTLPEPFGIVFIEALYAGLPVITTDMGGGAEIIDQTCGVLAAPDPESVAQALYTLVTDLDLRARLAHNAPARARFLCDPELRIRDIADAIRA